MENSKQLNLLKARNFGEKISDAFSLIRINLGVMLKAQFLISLPIIIVTAALFVLVFRDYFSLLSSIESGPFAGDGRLHPFKDTFISGFAFSDQDKADMIEFLNSLTDNEFVTSERLSNPWTTQ